MSEISGGNDTKIKQKTIAQAILAVMGETNHPMTSQEICQLLSPSTKNIDVTEFYGDELIIPLTFPEFQLTPETIFV